MSSPCHESERGPLKRRDFLAPELVAIFDRLREARVEFGKPTVQTYAWRDQKAGSPDGVTVIVDFDRIDIAVSYWAAANPETEKAQEALAHARRSEVLHLLDAEYRALLSWDSAKAAATKNSEKRKMEREQMRVVYQQYLESNPGATAWQFFHKTKHGFECTFPTFLKAIGRRSK